MKAFPLIADQSSVNSEFGQTGGFNSKRKGNHEKEKGLSSQHWPSEGAK